MAISKAQFKAANARGAAVIARGPIAQAARYDSRRGLVVISLEGGCEFCFPPALAAKRTSRGYRSTSVGRGMCGSSSIGFWAPRPTKLHIPEVLSVRREELVKKAAKCGEPLCARPHEPTSKTRAVQNNLRSPVRVRLGGVGVFDRLCSL